MLGSGVLMDIRRFAKQNDLTIGELRASNDELDYVGFTTIEFISKEKDDTFRWVINEEVERISDHLDDMENHVLDWLGKPRKQEEKTMAIHKVDHSEQVADLIEAAKEIIKNAESIVGTEERMTDLTVSIYIQPWEATRINVDRNIAVVRPE